MSWKSMESSCCLVRSSPAGGSEVQRGQLSAELLVPGEAARNDAAGLCARPPPVLELYGCPGPIVLVAKSVLPREHGGIGQATILVALQDDAASPRQFGHFLDR